VSSRLIKKDRLAEWARFELGAFAPPAEKARPADLSRDRQAAEDEGRQAGFRAGYAEGRMHVERFAGLAATLEAEIAGFGDRHAAALADLALEIARQMLRADMRVSREALVPVVREALASLPEGLRRPQIVMHPADVPLVRGQLGDLLERGGWIVVEDHRIAPGGCRIETESGDVDATLATRWRRLAASLGRDGRWDDDA
jgi:flagellar assembly protein FliH